MDPASQRSVHDCETCAGFSRRYPELARVFDGKPEGLTKDDFLDNVTALNAAYSPFLLEHSNLGISP